MRQIQKTPAVFALVFTLSACGGGGGATTQSNNQQCTIKTATISFNVFSTSRLAAPVQGVQLSAYLPDGVTVSTVASSTILSSASLTAGSGIISANRQVYGSYSAPIHKVKISVVTTEDTFRIGEFAKLP